MTTSHLFYSQTLDTIPVEVSSRFQIFVWILLPTRTILKLLSVTTFRHSLSLVFPVIILSTIAFILFWERKEATLWAQTELLSHQLFFFSL